MKWKAVEKKTLLEQRAVSLQAEPFFGEKRSVSDIERVSLSNVCEFIDYRGKTPEKSDKGVPLITAKNVRWGMVNKEPEEFVTEETYTKHMTRGFPKRGDVLFTTEAPLGMAALVDTDERFALAQRIICFSPNPERLVGGYLVQALLSKNVQEAIHSFASGATAQGIKASSLKEIEIPLPPLEEQRRLVGEIESYQQVLDGARQILANYQIKFDIEDEWPRVPLGEISVVDWGNTDLTKTSYVESGPYLGVSATGGDGRMNHYEHEPFVTVISAIGALCGKLFQPSERFTAIKNTMTVTAKPDVLDPKYLFAVLSSNTLPKRGAAQPFIAKGDVVIYEIPLPPLEEQRRIVVELDAEAAQMDSVRSLLPPLRGQNPTRPRPRVGQRRGGHGMSTPFPIPKRLRHACPSAWTWRMLPPASRPMNENTAIEFVLHGKVEGQEITPRTIGLSQFNEFNQEVEQFIGGSQKLKLDQVHVEITQSSYVLRALLPVVVMSSLEPDLKLMARQDVLGELDIKRAEVVQKWQARSKSNPDLSYEVRPEVEALARVRISRETDYRIGDIIPWVAVEKYLFGEVVDMGGHTESEHPSQVGCGRQNLAGGRGAGLFARPGGEPALSQGTAARPRGATLQDGRPAEHPVNNVRGLPAHLQRGGVGSLRGQRCGSLGGRAGRSSMGQGSEGELTHGCRGFAGHQFSHHARR